MKKEEFVEHIKRIQQESEYQDKIDKIQRQYELDYFPVERIQNRLVESIVELLENILDDKYKTIEWWIWECDFGKNNNIIWDSDTKEIIATIEKPEDLYDYIKTKKG